MEKQINRVIRKVRVSGLLPVTRTFLYLNNLRRAMLRRQEAFHNSLPADVYKRQ